MNRNDPFRTFNFRVEIDGSDSRQLSASAAAFPPMGTRSNTAKAPISTNNTQTDRPAGSIPTSPLSAAILNNELWDWYGNIVNGVPDRRNGSMILMDEQRKEVMRWSFENGWMNKIEAPSFNASGQRSGDRVGGNGPRRITFEMT